MNRDRLLETYHRLLEHFGPQHWWPAQSRFEIMVGAILTQNTAWTNVERAVSNLRAADRLAPGSIVDCPPDELARLLIPSGYFNVKARRLRSFCAWYLAQGEYTALSRLDDQALRRALLSVHGVGAETADDILLYAFERAVFVIDAYTRRLFQRLGEYDSKASYEALRQDFEAALGADVGLFNEYHALIVRQGKEVCRSRPRCARCALSGDCPSAEPEA